MNNGGFLWRVMTALLAATLAVPALAGGAASAPAATGAAASQPVVGQGAGQGTGENAGTEKILEQARARYYSLQRAGLAEFTCRVVPDWYKLLADVRKINAKEADRRVQVFGKIRFEAKVAVDGKISMTHGYDGQEPPDLAENFRRLYHGMEQMTTGFLESWRDYVMTPYLPEAGMQYTLEQDPSGYRVTVKEGNAVTLMLLDPELTIKSTRVTSADFDITYRPRFRKAKGGLLLNGFDSEYQGASPSARGVSHVVIEYQTVNGLQIPKKVSLSGVDEGANYAVEISFTECRASRRE